MTSHEESIKQLEAALEEAEYRISCLVKYGPTSYQVWHWHSGIDPMHELHAYYLKSKWTTPQNEPFREHQSLEQIRKGFVQNCEDEEKIAVLNKMLTEIYYLLVTGYEAIILAQKEKLSKLMM